MKETFYYIPEEKNPKRATWVYKYNEKGESYHYCSNCKTIIYDDILIPRNYCPCCGYDMRKINNEYID